MRLSQRTISAMAFPISLQARGGGLGCVAALAVEAIGFLCMGAHCLGRHLRRHHAVAQAGQHTAFH